MKFLKWFDDYILDLFNKRISTHVLDEFFTRFTNSAGVIFTSLLIAALIIFPKSWGLNKLGWNMALTIGILTLIVHIIKIIAKRIRPYMILEELNTFGIELPDYSFPSGHTATAVAICVVVSRYFPILLIPLIIYAILIGISRMYLGVHYPTDVVMGAILGLLVSYIIDNYFFEGFYSYLINL